MDRITYIVQKNYYESPKYFICTTCTVIFATVTITVIISLFGWKLLFAILGWFLLAIILLTLCRKCFYGIYGIVVKEEDDISKDNVSAVENRLVRVQTVESVVKEPQFGTRVGSSQIISSSVNEFRGPCPCPPPRSYSQKAAQAKNVFESRSYHNPNKPLMLRGHLQTWNIYPHQIMKAWEERTPSPRPHPLPTVITIVTNDDIPQDYADDVDDIIRY